MKTDELIEPEMTILKSHTEIQLPYGLLGFEEVKNYLIVIKPHEAPFMWLQMLAGARKSFLLVSPFLVLPDYQPDILAADVEFLGLEDPTDAILLNICTIRGPGKATLNLRGPIVINRHTLVGKQCIPNNSAQFALNHPLPVS